MMSRYEMRMMGILLLLMPLLIVISWSGLISRFDYPDILREPTSVILQQYDEGGITLKLYWAGMVLSSLLIIPVALSLYRLTNHANRSLSLTAAGIGITSAVFHVLGFSRWLFAVDYLAAQYVGTDRLSADQQWAIETSFNMLHMYLGVTIGETLGFLTMGIWAILTAVALYRSRYIHAALAVLSIGCGIGILAGILEWAGWSYAVEINAIAYQLWILIIAYLGITFIVRKGWKLPVAGQEPLR
ncbi:DUF4386 domain-containing protein [Cohnella herbarum]|uniref:DUF4386 domain-containing protein n=1 Tax=Cohnella herbarum TaxID=2728023 RepID=A0A7Z2ZP40_9BACL|nr:DUF4386 domain-containing protein [Cohnella herbarum]QJD85657.1 DUF4386 domain-containing protein [Cohnella herbarum]